MPDWPYGPVFSLDGVTPQIAPDAFIAPTAAVIGDVVNVASRVEQLNKRFGSLILATESTMRAAGDGFPAKRLGETGMRGHEGDVVVYQIDPA